MTQIIRIPTDASVETVRRMMAQATDPQVALALPAGWTGLANVAQLRLLQRQAQIQLMTVALITRNRGTHQAAQQIGVPVFVSEEAALRGNAWQTRTGQPVVDPQQPDRNLPDPPAWRIKDNGAGVMDQATRPSLHRSRRRRIQAEQTYRKPTPVWATVAGGVLTGALFLVMLGLFALYVIPAATVTLTPGQRELTVDVALIANPLLDLPDPGLNQIPARSVETRSVFTGTIPTSGREQLAVAKAQGSVTFSNKGRNPVRIPAGTTVRTGTGTPVSFVTLNDVEVPGPVGGQASVAIQAVETGAAGNVRANTINTVGGSLDFQVAVSNPGPTYNGASQLTAVVKQIDKDTLLDQLYTQAQEEAYATLSATLEPGEWLAPDSVRTQIVADVYSAFNDEPAEILELNLRVQIQGVAVEDTYATDAARVALQESVPTGGKLVANSVTFFRQGESATTAGLVNFTMRASGNYVIPVDQDEVRSAIAGQNEDEAINTLQSQWSLAETPTIFRDPQWGSALPAIPGRIQVRVEYGETE